MTPHTPEEWNTFVIVHNTMPPRDPEEDEEDGDEEEEEEEEEEEDEEDEAAQDRGSPPGFRPPVPTGDRSDICTAFAFEGSVLGRWIRPVVLDSTP
jgi:hypothetical protein